MKNQIRRARTCDVAFTYRMPAGIPGAITRASAATVEAAQLDVTNYPTSYGIACAIDATSHNARRVGGGDTAASVFGFYVRPYPTNSGTDGLGTSTPPTSGIGNFLRRGYMMVKLGYGTAVKGGTVYIRTVANGNSSVLGGVDAQADSTNNFALSNAMFLGAADANGNVEIAYNI